MPGLLEVGETIHVVERRAFEGDVRRHFLGTVEAVTAEAARVTGYAFVFDPATATFRKKPERRTRLLAVTDARLLINMLPADFDVENADYGWGGQGFMVLSDGKHSFDVTEFAGPR